MLLILYRSSRGTSKILPRIFDAVSEGLYRESKLEIKYVNTLDEEKSGIVSPLGLVQQEQRLYLVCKIDGYDNVRHLALHRISSVRVLDFAAERPADFALDRYVAERHFNYSNGRKIRLVLEFTNAVTAKNLEETPFNRTQAVVSEAPAPDPRWRITVDIEDSLLLDGWLAMRRASILSTKKTLIKTNDAAQQPAPKLRRASATQAL